MRLQCAGVNITVAVQRDADTDADGDVIRPGNTKKYAVEFSLRCPASS